MQRFFHPRYTLPILLVLLLTTIAAFVIVREELSDYLLASITVQAAPTTEERQFTWTPDASVALGEHTLHISATDPEGNVTTQQVTITVLAEDLQISDTPVIDARDNEATIIWTTTGDAVSQVDYDVAATTLRYSKDNPTRVSSHSITLDGLLT